jgi:hypothetical protein
MKPFEESAVIRYIENNQYQLTIREVAECFDVAMSTIKNMLQKNNIKLKYERNVNQTMKHVNEELKKNKEKIDDVLNVRKINPAHIEGYRNKLNLQLIKGPITVRHTDIGIEDVWDKIKHEYVYKVICPFERTYEIKRRLSDEKLQANSNRGDSKGQKSINNKESVTVVSICGNDNSVSSKRIDTKFKRGNSNMSKINQETKDKFIQFYIEQKKLKKLKKEIATKQTIFSYTTAVRVMKDVDSWTEEEMKEFEVRRANRLSMLSAFKEEPVSNIINKTVEQFEAELKDVEVAEEQTDEKCFECETELASQINEMAAKNRELQKELHTQKIVIETLQKGVNELNETVTESKIAIAEVVKERDDKDEEIRLLNLELQKYKNDLNSVLDDRQKLECLLSDNANPVELNPKYDSLYKVLLMAYNQASNGKGKERHANDEDFKEQKIVTLNKQIGSNHGAIFQACKKAQESARLPDDRAIAELIGAINYLAAAVIILQEEK